MQNKPNLLDAQMFLTFYLTKDYENNYKPNQSQFQRQKMLLCGA